VTAHRLAVPSLARWLLALGIMATLDANVTHGWTEGPVGAVVAAWSAASLVGGYELLLWLVRTAADGALVHEPVTDQMTGEASSVPGLADQGTDGRIVTPVQEMAEQDINGTAVAAYRESLERGKPLSERKLAAMFGKTSRRWARSRMAEARQPDEEPDVRRDDPSIERQFRAERLALVAPAVREAASAR